MEHGQCPTRYPLNQVYSFVNGTLLLIRTMREQCLQNVEPLGRYFLFIRGYPINAREKIKSLIKQSYISSIRERKFVKENKTFQQAKTFRQ